MSGAKRKTSEPTAGIAVASRINNEIVRLDETAEPVDRLTPEGSRIYKRSLALLLSASGRSTGVHIEIGAPIGNALLCSLNRTKVGNSIDTTVQTLMHAMEQYIKKKVEIELVDVPRGQVIARLEQDNDVHTLALVRATAKTHIRCHKIDDFLWPAAQLGPVVPNTGMLDANHFSIEATKDADGKAISGHRILLRHAAGLADGGFALVEGAEPVLLDSYLEREKWSLDCGFSSVAEVNAAICGSESKRLIQLSEADHDRQIVEIASRIAGSQLTLAERPQLVLIAGPSSSGKTTFAKRLCVALETLGARPAVISVDSYYKAWQDIDPRGAKHVDWEALDSLNLEQLNSQLLDLMQGKEVHVPEYDMRTSMPTDKSTWTPTKLRAPGGLVIMEGIHCLNPELTSKVERAAKFCICISPLGHVSLDDVRLVSSSHVRMLRRMVRDFLNRGRSAHATLRQWPSIARGERSNIFPHQNEADACFNSALAYEANVLKVFAEPLLRSITPEMAEYGEAQRLLQMLDQLVALPATIVPPQSLLREFIGGSWFYDFAGWYKSA